jgi:hypothetical protein
MCRILAGTLLVGVLVFGATTVPDATARTIQKRLPLQGLCAAAIDRQEVRHKIPNKLLQAISMVESGRWDPQTRRKTAWPWTVTANGKGRFFPTKQAAIAHVMKLKGQGIRVIDVGCMQVNLHYHPDAFKSLSAAFDPKRNADYAAKFLTKLKREHRSWRKAVQHYHSATPAKRVPYQNKVYAAWQDTKRQASQPDATAARSRLNRTGRQIERAHRSKLSRYKRPSTAAAIRKSAARPKKSGNYLSQWPPRSVKEQRRAQNLARIWAMEGRQGAKKP